MANTAGIATYNAARTRMHSVLWPSSGIKVALYGTGASVGPTTTAYTTSGEATGPGYTAGGITVNSGTAVAISGNTTYVTPAADPLFSAVTIGPVDAAMFYDTGASSANILVSTFGAQTLTGGNLTIAMPVNAVSTALFRFDWS